MFNEDSMHAHYIYIWKKRQFVELFYPKDTK